MACTVYCLVPRIEHLAPLVERLKDAGVSPRDIMVVLRKDVGATSVALGRRMMASNLAPILWSLPLGSVWWWLALSICGLSSACRPAVPDHKVVIPMALYRKKRR